MCGQIGWFYFLYLISERVRHYEMSLKDCTFTIFIKTKDYHHYAIDCDIKITYMCVVHSFVELVFKKVMCGAFQHGNVLSLSAAWVMSIYAYI